MKELNAWSKSFLHTSSMSKHWRICVLSGVVVFSGLGLAANVIDDSLFWWRGPHDANGDGCISAEEILNARFPKNDSSHQGVTLYGNANVQENDNVHSPWNGVLSSTMSMRFVADTAYASSLNIPVSKTSLTSDTSSFTLHLRCKWDGDFGADGGSRANLFYYGNSWNERRGGSLSFVPADNGSGGIIRFDNGRHQYSTEFAIETNVWYDVFYRIDDPAPSSDVNHNVNIDVYLFKDRTLSESMSCKSHWSSWRTPSADIASDNTKYVSAELRRTDNIVVCQYFKGNIAQFGFWDRVLNIDEMREVSAHSSPFPDLIRLGDLDGRGDEFAADGSLATDTIILPGGRLDRAPAVLTSERPSVSISFCENGIPVHTDRNSIDEITGYETLPQLLTIKTIPGSPVCCVDVTLDGNVISRRTILPDRPGHVYIKAMNVGNHTLTITRIGTADVHLDQIRLGGSWCLGDRFYEIPQKGNQYRGGHSPYVVHLDSATSNMCGSVAGSATSGATVSFSFDMPPDMASYAYRYDARISQCLNNVPPKLILYVNGAEYGRYQLSRAWGLAEIAFPAGTFVPGRNTIAWRYDSDHHSSDYWVGIRSHTFTLASRPSRGTWLIFR